MIRIIILGNQSGDPVKKKDLMKEIVKLIESKKAIGEKGMAIQEKIEFCANTKQTEKAEELQKQDDELRDTFFIMALREEMLLNQAVSRNENFISN
jgi:hypothetical protein